MAGIPGHGGRPRKFETPEDIESLSKAYFMECDSNEPPTPYTVTGLAEALGTFRIVLTYYEKGTYDVLEDKENGIKPVMFSYAMKRAKSKVERYAEEHIYDKTAGAVFTLVNMTRNSEEPWKNAQHQDVNVSGSLDITDKLKEARERSAAG